MHKDRIRGHLDQAPVPLFSSPEGELILLELPVQEILGPGKSRNHDRPVKKVHRGDPEQVAEQVHRPIDTGIGSKREFFRNQEYLGRDQVLPDIPVKKGSPQDQHDNGGDQDARDEILAGDLECGESRAIDNAAGKFCQAKMLASSMPANAVQQMAESENPRYDLW